MTRQYPAKRPTVVDFFCGAGGLSLGFEQAGFDIVLGVDSDGHHIATHERNFPYGESFCGSIVDLDGDKVRELAHCKEIDVVIGGPPCQGFSHMGLRDLKDPRNSLVRHYMRLVLELRPKAFLMENVPGLLSGETRKILNDVIQLAEEGGYVITTPVRVLDAADFGVPQKRKRLFLIGTRKDISGVISYPTGACKGQPPRPTVIEAISDLPDVDKRPELMTVGFTSYTKEPKSLYAKVARGLLDDPSDLSLPREWPQDICTGCLRVLHAPKSVELYRATPPGQTVPGHKLPRLDPNGIAPTLRAGSDSTHGSYTAPRPIHPLHPRCITAREAARLHGFPDWFAFYPLKWHAYRQIGNAVCPPIARALGSQFLNVLTDKRTTKKPKTITVGDTFVLPDDRPRMLKRIPVMQEFPPVIKYLFAQAFDGKQLRKPTFSFKDVQEAVAATGANLHWIREDTFVAEVARSRAVKRIIAPVLAAGYSIKSIKDKGMIGRFVPIGTAGSVEDRETIQIRIDEIHNAIPLGLPSMHLNGQLEVVEAVIAEPEVRQRIWGFKKSSVTVHHSVPSTVDLESSRASVYRIDVSSGRGPKKQSVILTSPTPTPVAKARIARVAADYDSEEVVLMVSATSKHFIAIRYDNCLESPQEKSRTAFILEG